MLFARDDRTGRRPGHRRVHRWAWLVGLAVLVGAEVMAWRSGVMDAGTAALSVAVFDLVVAAGMIGYAVGPALLARDSGTSDLFEFRLGERLNRILPPLAATALRSDVLAVRAVILTVLRRRPRALLGMSEPLLVGYARGVLPMLVGAAFGDVVLVVVLAVALPAGPARTAVHLVGALGLVWTVGFLTSLRVYRHAVDASAARLRFAGLYDAIVQWQGQATLTHQSRSWEGGRSGMVIGDSLVFPIMNATNVHLVLPQPAVVRSVNRHLDGAEVSHLHFAADTEVVLPSTDDW